MSKLEPLAGIEPATAPLPWACSTTEPQWRKILKNFVYLRLIKIFLVIYISVNSLRKFFSSLIYSFLSILRRFFKEKLTEYKVFSKNSSLSEKNCIFMGEYETICLQLFEFYFIESFTTESESSESMNDFL